MRRILIRNEEQKSYAYDVMVLRDQDIEVESYVWTLDIHKNGNISLKEPKTRKQFNKKSPEMKPQNEILNELQVPNTKIRIRTCVDNFQMRNNKP